MNLQVTRDAETEIRASMRPAKLAAGGARLARLAEELRRLDDALDRLADLAGENSTRAVKRLRQDLAQFEPSVTILGQVKSGKTTLVNAMAGWADLLPSDVNPWTSVVTSLHLKPSSQPTETGATFRFMTQRDWDRLLSKGGRIGELASRAGAESELQKIGEQIEKVRAKAQARLGRKFDLLLGEEHSYGYFDKNLLERYICLGDDFDTETDDPGTADQGRFADVLSSADLYLNCPTIPVPICLRDTPGVNDTFLMREQVTIQAIRDSGICVVVLSAGQALSSVDMGLVRMISNVKSRNVLIFVNRIDELSDPVNQIPEIETSIRATLRDQHGPEGVAVLFGSAYWANKVLTGTIEDMPEASRQALLNWAEASAAAQVDQTQPQDIVWELSGMAGLFRALSDRVVDGYAAPLLKKVSNAAITIATSQQAAGMVRIEGGAGDHRPTTYDVLREFGQLATAHADALERELDVAIAEYHRRADRAHETFVDRALQSLLAHIEQRGQDQVWNYDPVGLRMLLRSAYSVFGKRVRAVCEKRFEAAVTDVAVLYAQAFGPVVEGIQISAPDLPEFPAPVSLGQTIALDFNDGWWVSWWTRIRGFNAFSKRFNKLIRRETEDFMTQLKSVQTDLVRAQTLAALSDFFDQHTDITKDISLSTVHRGDIQDLFLDKEEGRRRAMLEDVIADLQDVAVQGERV